MFKFKVMEITHFYAMIHPSLVVEMNYLIKFSLQGEELFSQR